MLSSMGVEVVDERPYELDHDDHPSYIYDFGLRYAPGMPDKVREPFQDTIRAVWGGYNEIDGFNALVLGAGLTWRQATVLRAYAKYMKQGNSPFAVDYIEEALRGNTDITRLLVQLFEARFDPGRNGLAADAEARTARVEEIARRIERALDDVASLDQDRILRSYLTLIKATLRTNYFQPGSRRAAPTYMSFKLEPVGDPGPARAAAAVRDLRLLARGSRACTCASARSRAAACAGRTAATTSAPRCSAWSRRRW